MKIDENVLKFEEKVVFALRRLYAKAGYHQFKMSKFEEYDLYSKNKDFLVSEGVITFNDTNGKLLALKPDVTLSIIKNSRDLPGVTEKYYYNENVYRISETSQTYKEILQTGLECIGDISREDLYQVVRLAIESLECIGKDFVFCISHIGLLNAMLEGEPQAEEIRRAVAEKNLGLLDADLQAKFACFVRPDCLKEILRVAETPKAKEAAEELQALWQYLADKGWEDRVTIDFSFARNDGYYSGIIFKGFLNGLPSHILSGGQYDKLMRRMNRTGGAVGFAVYLDALERLAEVQQDDFINIALPKGRLGEKVYGMFEKAGFDCPSIREENRKLIFENKEKKLRFFWVKPSDVAIYVERGAADIGVAGKDILLEYRPDVFELLDLNVGKCRMAVAAKKDFNDDLSKTLRVATKFSNIAKSYYASKCRDIDIIHLNGSIEIAPILGLSDVIVDIVETGKTLLENDLMPFETIVPISARLISNKASYGFKTGRIEDIKAGLSKVIE